MNLMRGQGSIQMLLAAEQEAQLIVAAARNLKMARLRQAKEEAEREVESHRSHQAHHHHISKNLMWRGLLNLVIYMCCTVGLLLLFRIL